MDTLLNEPMRTVPASRPLQAQICPERLFRSDDILDEGEQLFAVRRRRHAVVVPGDQGHAPFAFDGIQQMCDP